MHYFLHVKSFHYLLLLMLYQQVVLQKAATKQVNHMQNRFIEKKVHSERSAESCATRRKVQKEELTGLLNNGTAQVRGFCCLFVLFCFFLNVTLEYALWE